MSIKQKAAVLLVASILILPYSGLSYAFQDLPSGTVNRIAVGSCLDQNESLDILHSIQTAAPQLLIMAGDNVYAEDESDDPALLSLRAAYDALGSAPQFQALKQTTPIVATWDDHDYGLNDAGREFRHRAKAEMLFETFWEIPQEDDSRRRPGIYRSLMLGQGSERIQVIILDTRFFRSELKRPWIPRLNGRYIPQDQPGQTMLGVEQWEWLEKELIRPAAVRILVSSVQVLADGHHWEAWRMLPDARGRLLTALAESAGTTILLSGDRHLAGLYRKRLANDRVLWEMTSSSLNLPLSQINPAVTGEGGTHRVGEVFLDANFGWLEFDWKQRSVTMQIRNSDNAPVRTATVFF